MSAKKNQEQENLQNRGAGAELNISSTGYGLESSTKPNKTTLTTEDSENVNSSCGGL